MRRIFLRRLGHIVLRLLAALVVLSVIAGLTGLVVVQSGWFHEYVRRQIIAQVERATGGRVELGRFSFRGGNLTAQVSQLVLHGKEPAGEEPLLQVESVKLRLRVLSFLEHRVDLATLQVEHPRLRIVFYPDGSNNLPSPRQRSTGKSWAEEVLNLAVGQYQLSDGLVEYDDQQVPLNLRGDGLEVRMSFDALTPAYRGELTTQHLRVLPGGLAPVETAVAATFSLEKSRVVFSKLRLYTKESRADLTGELQDLRTPHGRFTLKATTAMRELVRMFPVPLDPAGSGNFDGTLSISFAKPFELGISGRVQGRGVGYTRDRLKVEGADVLAEMKLGLHSVSLQGVRLNALGATFTGSGTLNNWRNLHLDGGVEGLTVAQAARIATDRAMPWNGTLSGNFVLDSTVTGTDSKTGDARVQADLLLSPAPEGTPISGRVAGVYDQAAGEITLNPSFVTTPATQLNVAGTLGSKLQVQLRCTNLEDLLPALAVVNGSAPREFPFLKLNTAEPNTGKATADGLVLGTLDNPHFQGAVSVTNGSVEGHPFDSFSADVDATHDTIAMSRFTISRAAAEAAGSATIAARNGVFDDAALSGQVSLRNVPLDQLVKEAGSTVELMGVASATARISGSVSQPQADVTLDAQRLAAFGEQLDRLRAAGHVSLNSLEVSSGTAESGPARIQFSGKYQPSTKDWKAGDLQFQTAVENLNVTRVKALASLKPPVEARLTADLRGQGHVAQGQFTLISASGSASARGVTVDRQPVGDVALTAETRGSDVSLTAKGTLKEASFQGQGSWRLDGDEPGSATFRFTRMNVASVHQLVMLGGTPEQEQSGLPFEGFLEGQVTVSGPLQHPKDFQAELTLDTLQLNAKPGQSLPLGVQAQDLVLRNSQPVVVAVSSREAQIRSAHFTGRDTNIEASGTVPIAGGGADVTLHGTVNLIALQLLNPDLIAQGNATVQATVRGMLRDPSVNGRMELADASLFLNDVTNGVEKAKGVILFDRNRATIQDLTAETGGGKASITGFLEFGSPLIYRLQANVQQVRMRLPNELSITSNATLALNGTSEASTLSGNVTLLRAAFNPRTDLFQLLAASARPVPAASANDYLRGMQFDVRLQNDPNFELQTSLTRDVEAEVDLRLRGTIPRPALLGTISVNQGEVELLGNRYTIDRGDIRFLNPVKIEPTFDVNLETRAKGVTVNISLSGTMDKIKANYSSDPPLQSSEIIALLAVGRDPTQALGVASAAQSSASSASFVEAGGGLLSQAVTAQLSSKFQRFLGASRFKIDPAMTGVDTSPQARLTFEQQVSKDITLTYITNLNYTAEQIVRFEWNLNRQWSAVAVRDSNGLFGIDIQYRKRFK